MSEDAQGIQQNAEIYNNNPILLKNLSYTPFAPGKFIKHFEFYNQEEEYDDCAVLLDYISWAPVSICKFGFGAKQVKSWYGETTYVPYLFVDVTAMMFLCHPELSDTVGEETAYGNYVVAEYIANTIYKYRDRNVKLDYKAPSLEDYLGDHTDIVLKQSKCTHRKPSVRYVYASHCVCDCLNEFKDHNDYYEFSIVFDSVEFGEHCCSSLRPILSDHARQCALHFTNPSDTKQKSQDIEKLANERFNLSIASKSENKMEIRLNICADCMCLRCPGECPFFSNVVKHTHIIHDSRDFIIVPMETNVPKQVID